MNLYKMACSKSLKKDLEKEIYNDVLNNYLTTIDLFYQENARHNTHDLWRTFCHFINFLLNKHNYAKEQLMDFFKMEKKHIDFENDAIIHLKNLIQFYSNDETNDKYIKIEDIFLLFSLITLMHQTRIDLLHNLITQLKCSDNNIECCFPNMVDDNIERLEQYTNAIKDIIKPKIKIRH